MMNVTYLSDSDSDFQCLEEYLKQGAFGKLHDQKLYATHFDSKSQSELFRLIGDRLGLDGSALSDMLPNTITLPTRYESPLSHKLVRGLVEKIKNAAKKTGIDTSTFPCYSSIPTRMVNAQAVKLPCSKRTFLLFDSQLFTYCHLFAKAFALCLPVISSDDGFSFSVELENVQARISNTPECIDRFADLLGALEEFDVPGHAKPYIPDAAYARLSLLFLDGMELFVVAHEFGHVYANHLENLLPRASFHAQQNDASSSSHIQEFQADVLGLFLMLIAQSKSGFDAGLSYIGAELFFHALEMQEKFSYLMDNNSTENYVSHSSDTHPSHSERRMALRHGLSQMIEQTSELESALRLADQYAGVVDIVWNGLKDRHG